VADKETLAIGRIPNALANGIKRALATFSIDPEGVWESAGDATQFSAAGAI